MAPKIPPIRCGRKGNPDCACLCEGCGEVLAPRHSRPALRPARFCGRACRLRHARRLDPDTNAKNYALRRRRRRDRVCADCGIGDADAGAAPFIRADQCGSCNRHEARFGRTHCCDLLPTGGDRFGGLCPGCPGPSKSPVVLVAPDGRERTVYARSAMLAPIAAARGVAVDELVLDAHSARAWALRAVVLGKRLVRERWRGEARLLSAQRAAARRAAGKPPHGNA